jgi:hypothetical protein
MIVLFNIFYSYKKFVFQRITLLESSSSSTNNCKPVVESEVRTVLDTSNTEHREFELHSGYKCASASCCPV